MKFLVRKIILLLVISISIHHKSNAQLQVTNVSNAQALVQMLLGQGISVSNVTLTGHPAMSGFFRNISGTNIGIDSGIVLTNGCAQTNVPIAGHTGMNLIGAGTAATTNAYNRWNYPGDVDLSAVVNDVTKDACVLEFDFVPLGDSIKFRYVFGSEEYTNYACSQFNDAFAFFISGPGIVGLKNIALIPGTNLPVTIHNVNSHPCALYPQYYVDNLTNRFFTYDGHTTVFTALAQVQPCQTYHLKLVIADVSDDDLDSGVFLEAKSLSSNAIVINNITQTDGQNNSYLVEGCSTGAFKIKRPVASPSPLIVTLFYTGTATNGVDMQTLPTTVTIPADSLDVTVDVLPIIDNIPEGIETINVFALAGCTQGTPTDSTVIQIRDYDTLGITPDTAMICKSGSVQLKASPGYTVYQWDPNPTLSSTSVPNPFATPVNAFTTYYCTATEGTCHGRDSSFLVLKKLNFVSKQEINCKNDATGEIRVMGGPGWIRPTQYNINGGPWQADSTFSNLPVGTYTIKIIDAAGCIDSMVINITQLYPDLQIANAPITAATCAGNPDGTATVSVNGGKPPYLYSSDGVNFQPGNVLNLTQGNYTITVMDNNNCTQTKNIFVPLFNHLTLDAGYDLTICEGRSKQLNPVSNADGFSWSPATGLSSTTIANPIASPSVTTKYYLTATSGICSILDSLTAFVLPSPKADAGSDQTICFGTNTSLSGLGGVNYFWSPSSYLNDRRSATPMVKMPPGTITYALNVIDANGCASLQPDFVTVTVTREAKVFAGNDTTLAIGQPLPLQTIDLSGSGFTQYEWIPHDGLNDPFRPDPVALPTRNMWYTVLARTALGCTARDDIKVTVYLGPEIYVPNAFTPNRDGTNDVLKVVPAGIKEFHYFHVYDRWGRLLFATTEASNSWDGKLKGVVQPIGTYIWMAEGVDYKGNLVNRKGTVIIMK